MFSDNALLRRFCFLEEYGSIALAVSGGADSMALLYLIAQWRQALLKRKLSGSDVCSDLPEIHILTVNHGLRDEAAAETRFVLEHVEELGFLGKTLLWLGEKPSTSLQESAREARYTLCTDYCKSNNIEVMLTAHHIGDQVETFLMRLARGSGVDGLSSIGKHAQIKSVHIFRPLLDLSKQQLQAYLIGLGKEWVEDPSNQDSVYERVQLREKIKYLKELNLSQQAIYRSVRRLSMAREALDYAANQLFLSDVQSHPAPVFYLGNKVFEDVPKELVVRLFRMMLGKMSPSQNQAELARVERVVADFIAKAVGSCTLAGCGMQCAQGGVYMFREVGRGKSLGAVQILSQDQSVEWHNGDSLLCYKGSLKDAFQVKPLGRGGFAPFRKALAQDLAYPTWFGKMPSAVGASFLSVWKGAELVAVPDLDYYGAAYDSSWFKVVPKREKVNNNHAFSKN